MQKGVMITRLVNRSLTVAAQKSRLSRARKQTVYGCGLMPKRSDALH